MVESSSTPTESATASRPPIASVAAAIHALPGVTAVTLDFRDRSHGPAALDAIGALVAAGRFGWIDIDLDLVRCPLADIRGALPGALADGLATVHPADSIDEDAVCSLARGESFLSIRLVGVRIDEARLSSEIVDIVLAEGLLLTVHRGPCGVLDAVRRDYLQDFLQHASTPSFLTYELWSRQVEQFLMIEGWLDKDVDATRVALGNGADEQVLKQLADVSGRLLTLRKRVLPARRVLEELVSWKTTLISEATLGFLATMIGTLERLLTDIASNREILDRAMDLSITVTTHRTNMTMNRLAVVSTIFLPLTFLCGIYGMNFRVMPETQWAHGYTLFWVLSALITVGLTLALRRAQVL